MIKYSQQKANHIARWEPLRRKDLQNRVDTKPKSAIEELVSKVRAASPGYPAFERPGSQRTHEFDPGFCGSGVFCSWVWVKKVYPTWNPGKWKHGLNPAVFWLLNFDRYPDDEAASHERYCLQTTQLFFVLQQKEQFGHKGAPNAKLETMCFFYTSSELHIGPTNRP